MSLVLIRPAVDSWMPGQHTGTFRGNNLAFVTARALLRYWKDDQLSTQIARHQLRIRQRLAAIVQAYPQLGFTVRGRGMIHGLDVRCGRLARAAIDRAFASGLVIEGAGAYDEVLKVMPALTISSELLDEGLDLLEAAIAQAVQSSLHDDTRHQVAEVATGADTPVLPPLPIPSMVSGLTSLPGSSVLG